MTHGDPPALPAELWDGPAIRAAVAARHFGRLLRAYRRSGRVTQAQLAHWLDLTQGQVSRLETADRPPSDLAKLSRWATTLGIPPRLLWFEAAHSAPVGDAEPDGMTALFDRLEGQAAQRSQGDVLHNAADVYLRSGWTAYFTGRAALGQRHLDLALRIAHDTADHVLIAHCLAAGTHQALFYAPTAAIGLSRQTARAAGRAGLPRLGAEAHAEDAQGDR